MKLYCRTYLSENLEELVRPPIIFLHGLGQTGDTFKKVAPEISKRTKRKAYVLDLRNHGRSPWVKEMNYDVLTNDVLEVMQENSIPKAILIGNSMGGRIAMSFALKYPHKVDIIVVEDMTPSNIISSDANEKLLSPTSPDTVLNMTTKKWIENLQESWPYCSSIYDPDCSLVTKEKKNSRLKFNVDVVVGLLEKVLAQNALDMGLTFSDDVLFLYGSEGYFILDTDPSIKKLFPKARVKRIEGASHLIHIDSPEEYTNIVSDFILRRNLQQSKY